MAHDGGLGHTSDTEGLQERELVAWEGVRYRGGDEWVSCWFLIVVYYMDGKEGGGRRREHGQREKCAGGWEKNESEKRKLRELFLSFSLKFSQFLSVPLSVT